jgi:hypothetical protein
MEAVHEPLDGVNQKSRVARRECLRLGAGGAAMSLHEVIGAHLSVPANQISSNTNAGNGVDEDGGLRASSGVSINQSNTNRSANAGHPAIRRRT